MNSDPLFQEIDAAVQHDRMVALWKQYRITALVAIAGIILFTLGLSEWRGYQEKLNGAALQEFDVAQKAFADKKFDIAAGDFAAIAAHPHSKEVGDMAHLWQARALIATQKISDATPILKDLAEHPQSKQRIWSDLACLRLANIDATQATCLTTSEASPLAAERKLTQAAILWDAGKTDAARALLIPLTNDNKVNPTVRSRAQALLSVLPPAAAPSPEEKK